MHVACMPSLLALFQVTHPWEQTVAELEQNGYAVVENAISAEQIARVLKGAKLVLLLPASSLLPLQALTVDGSLCLIATTASSLLLLLCSGLLSLLMHLPPPVLLTAAARSYTISSTLGPILLQSDPVLT